MSLSIKVYAQSFFDKEAVQQAVGKASASVMGKQGGYVRKVAQNSIRRGKKTEVSAPGQPPISHTGALKRFIYYALDRQSKTVVVGPARLDKPGLATAALEYGGETTNAAGQRGRIRARPFMGPALEKSEQKVASFWKNAVSK